MLNKIFNNIFYCACLAAMISLGMIRSYPLYGKIDFFLLDGRPWWPQWETLVQETRKIGNNPVYTDYTTGYILAGIFGQQTVLKVSDYKVPRLYIEDMVENKVPEGKFTNIFFIKGKKYYDFRCVVNLIGYQSSWVPDETRHWDSNLADTSRLYQFKNAQKSLDIFTELEHFPLKKCVVYFPAEKKK
jgi:hypothetical protein